MGIDINPSDVLRSADSVDAAAKGLGAGSGPGSPGNDGFSLSAAISRFSSRMSETTDLAATDASTTADKMVASATLMRRVDDNVTDVVRSMWKRVV